MQQEEEENKGRSGWGELGQARTRAAVVGLWYGPRRALELLVPSSAGAA